MDLNGGITEACTSTDFKEDEAITKAWTNLNSKLGKHPNEGLQPTIYRVHRHLRDVKCSAYEPEVISIGPYHRGKDHLKMMEDHKLHNLQLLVKYRYVDMKNIAKEVGIVASEARKCYADQDFELSDNEFIEMLVLDGCFIIELVQGLSKLRWSKEAHPIFQMGWMICSLQRDLMLFENQIPFFVLVKLFNLIHPPPVELVQNPVELVQNPVENPVELVQNPVGLVQNLSHFFSGLNPGSAPSAKEVESRSSEEAHQGSQKFMHILDLIHRNLLPESQKSEEEKSDAHSISIERKAPASQKSEEEKSDTHMKGIKDQRSLIRLLSHEVFKFLFNVFQLKKDVGFKNCATRLTEANVKFGMHDATSDKTLFDIEFKDGTMVMSPLVIEDYTESWFRNLIAYEQYFKDSPHNLVTQYMRLLDMLINSARDVEILSQIIKHSQGDDEVVAKMVNRLGDLIVNDTPNYTKLFEDVNEHCRKRKNRWMAKLRRDYLHSPWAIISILAAVVLLLLTVVQTVFTLLQGVQ